MNISCRRSVNHTLTCEAGDISRNTCVGLCHAIGNDARQIVPTHGLNHQMHVLACRKARTYSYHKRCHIYDVRKIGDIVQKGDEIARIYPDKGSYDNKLSEYVPVNATITGIIRGLIREGYYFKEGFKIADIDPREGELSNCFTISDKARSIAGSVLEAVSAFEHGIRVY